MAILLTGKYTYSADALPSKSEVQRRLFLSASCDRQVFIPCPSVSKDIDAAVRCLAALGADIEWKDGGFFCTPFENAKESAVIDCGESAAVLRFIIPFAFAAGVKKLEIITHGRLSSRPLEPLIEEMNRHGILCERSADMLRFSGRMSGHDFSIDCSLTSQFLSGILLSLALMGGSVSVEGECVSTPYIDLTLSVMREFGVEVKLKNGTYTAYKNKLTAPEVFYSEGDWSTAAPFLTAGIIGDHPVSIGKLHYPSAQADAALIDILSRAGAEFRIEDGCVTALPSELRAFECSVKDCPDIAPLLVIAALSADGTSRVKDVSRLRWKESNRVEETVKLAVLSGGKVYDDEDDIVIEGGKELTGGKEFFCDDHRIAMCAAVAAVLCREPITLTGEECVKKSCPGFFEMFAGQ